MTAPARHDELGGSRADALRCPCCDEPVIGASALPEARWLRAGDRYCASCRVVLWREQVQDGWPTQRRLCRTHRERTGEAG